MHWTGRFLDVGYRHGADGPEEYDCWHFARWVWREHYGIETPPWPTPGPVADSVRAIALGVDSLGWRKVDPPQDGDGVLLGRSRAASHIGIFVGGRSAPAILHCYEGGPRLQSLSALEALHWRPLGYYRYGAL